MSTIFVSCAAYRDKELTKTLHSLIDNADNPEDLYIGVLSQDGRHDHPDLSFVDNLRYEKIHYKHAKGAGYARKKVMELYQGEDYFFQIDSHMRFAPHWDTEMLTMHTQTATEAGTEKVILSQFPAPYEPYTDGTEGLVLGDKDYWDDVSWTTVVYTYYGAWAGHRNVIEDKSKPHKSHTVLAAMIFAPGTFVEEIPYDERITFMGEELCIAIRAYTRGWEIYAPNKMLMWHYYNRTGPKVWSQIDDTTRPYKWKDLEWESKKVQQRVLLGIEQGIYGIGDIDRYFEYQKMVDIDFASFYDLNIASITNGGVLHTELTMDENGFNETKISGYCKAEFHSDCRTIGCDCTCHGGNNE